MKLDGNLVLNSDATGQIENVYIERLSAAPAFSSSEIGRIYFDTVHRSYFYNNGTTWASLSSGGTSGGSITLAGLLDVSLSSLVNNQYLQYNSALSKWDNTTLVLADVTDVTATAAQVNVLNGYTGTTANLNVLSGTTASASDLSSITGYALESVSATVFGYLSGVTSPIQTQINNLQLANSGLNSFGIFANGSATGLVVKTGVDTFATATLTSNNSNLIISNGAGPSNPTFSLAGNLESLATLTGTGFITFNGSTLGTATISSNSSSTINVVNGNGVGSTTLGLASVAQVVGGTLQKVSIDSYGRVVASSAVSIGDLTNYLGSYYLPEAGGSMSGPIIFNNIATITGLPLPVNSSDVATKAYVDASSSSLIVHSAVAVASTANLSLTYSNGSSGVGATLSGSSITSIDNVSLTVGMRVLLKDQTTQFQNGVYVVTTLSPFVLTRASDANTGTLTGMAHGFYVYVNGGGTVNGSTSWTETAQGSGTSGAFNIGTDSIVFTQFSSAGSYQAGTGLSLSGGVFSVDYGAGISALPSGDVGVAVYGGALILTTNGTSSNPVAGSSLALLLASGSGLTQSSAGLSIGTSAVTNSMLANSSISLAVSGTGSGSISLGGTLSLLGDGAAISTSATGSTVTISAAKATTSSVGVASFINSTFAVSGAGQVSILNGAITNGQLVNSSWNINGTTGGAQPVLLGSTLSIVGGSSPIYTTSMAGVLTINVSAATATTLGLASFAGSYFSVTSGAVSLSTTLGSGGITNVSATVNSAASGDLLQYSTTNSKWSNVPVATVLSNAGFKNTYFLYTASSALTTHTVVHNLGQQYCIVQVIDQTSTNLNNAIMPANIYFQSSTTLVVTFTVATLCNIVVMG